MRRHRPPPPAPDPELARVTEAQWRALAGRTVFFAHQSVGRDLMAGVREIAALDPRVRLRVVTTDDLAWVPGPALVEASVGRNGDPAGKTEAFVRALDAGLAPGAEAVALLKYCYADFWPDGDPEAILAGYRAATDALRLRHPGLALAHVTVPLTEDRDPRWRRLARRALGRRRGAGEPIARINRYNRLLRAEHAGRGEPVFDLARLESTGADGRRVCFELDGEPVFTLAPEWTHDGGHLNAAGRRRAAAAFLAFLAGLPLPAPSRAP